LGIGFINRLDDRWRLAKYMVASGMVPQKRAEETLVVMLKGYELGIPPMMAASNIHVIQGKPTLSADLMCALAAQRASVKWKIVTESAEEAEIVFTRPGWEEYRSRFTMQDAKDQGLTTKDNWKKMPRQMLLARAKSHGARQIAPDVLAGTYSYEEMYDTERVNGGTVNHVAGTVDDLNASLKVETIESKVVEDSGEAPERDVTPDDSSDVNASGAGAEPDGLGLDDAQEADLDDRELARLDAQYQDVLQEVRPDWTLTEKRQFEVGSIGSPSKDWTKKSQYKEAIDMLVATGPLKSRKAVKR
jgi:hypothetical protein